VSTVALLVVRPSFDGRLFRFPFVRHIWQFGFGVPLEPELFEPSIM
jgi:hypothetical protein